MASFKNRRPMVLRRMAVLSIFVLCVSSPSLSLKVGLSPSSFSSAAAPPLPSPSSRFGPVCPPRSGLPPTLRLPVKLKHKGKVSFPVVSPPLFKKRLDLFSPLVGSSFRLLVLPLAAADFFFRPPLVMANGGFRRYGRCAFGASYSLQWLSIRRLLCDLFIRGVFCW